MQSVTAEMNSLAWILLLKEVRRGNPQALQTLQEYASKIKPVAFLARECLQRLPYGHESRLFFTLLGGVEPTFIASLNPQIDPYGPPMSSDLIFEHRMMLKRLAAFHNRAAGKRKIADRGFLAFFARMFESSIEQAVPELNPEAPEIQELLPQLQQAIRAQLDAAANLSWNIN